MYPCVSMMLLRAWQEKRMTLTSIKGINCLPLSIFLAVFFLGIKCRSQLREVSVYQYPVCPEI